MATLLPLCAECGGCPPLLGATSKLCRSHHGVLSVSRAEATARCPARDHGLCQGLLWAGVTVCGVSRPASQCTHRHHQQASHHLQDCSKERQGVGVQTHTYCPFSATATPAQPLPSLPPQVRPCYSSEMVAGCPPCRHKDPSQETPSQCSHTRVRMRVRVRVCTAGGRSHLAVHVCCTSATPPPLPSLHLIQCRDEKKTKV